MNAPAVGQDVERLHGLADGRARLRLPGRRVVDDDRLGEDAGDPPAVGREVRPVEELDVVMQRPVRDGMDQIELRDVVRDQQEPAVRRQPGLIEEWSRLVGLEFGPRNESLAVLGQVEPRPAPCRPTELPPQRMAQVGHGQEDAIAVPRDDRGEAEAARDQVGRFPDDEALRSRTNRCRVPRFTTGNARPSGVLDVQRRSSASRRRPGQGQGTRRPAAARVVGVDLPVALGDVHPPAVRREQKSGSTHGVAIFRSPGGRIGVRIRPVPQVPDVHPARAVGAEQDGFPLRAEPGVQRPAVAVGRLDLPAGRDVHGAGSSRRRTW